MWSLENDNEKGIIITMTKQDTPDFDIECTISDAEGNVEEYVPETGDKIMFAAKKKPKDSGYLFAIEIPTDTMKLQFKSSDTEDLDYGSYIFDISLNKTNGYKNTFIFGTLVITTEVYDE